MPPLRTLALASLSDALRLGIFTLVALSLNLLSIDWRRSKRQVERLDRELLALTRESAEQLELALTAAQMGMWHWNILTGEIHWSLQTEQLFGLAPGTFDGSYKTFEACLHPDDREALKIVEQRAIQEKHIYQHEYRVVWADGSIHWRESRGQAFYDETGRAVRMTGTVMDISDRKNAEAALQTAKAELERRVRQRTAELSRANALLQREQEALRESEERFRSAVDYASIGMGLAGLDGRWLQVNSSLCEIVGYDKPELLALTFQEITHPDDLETDLNAVQQLLKGEIKSFELEKRYIHKQGHEVWILLSVSLMRDRKNQPLYFIAQVQDISDRKLAEEKLKKSEAFLTEAQRVAHVGSWEFDVPTGKITWSEEKRQIFGLDPTQSEPTYREFIELIHPDDRVLFEQKVNRALADGTPYQIDFRIRQANNEASEAIRHIDSRGEAVFNAQGQVIQLYGAVLDITERKQTEATLREAERRWRSLLENVRLVVVGLDITGKVEFVNAFFLELTGYTRAEVLGKDWLTFLPQHARERVRTIFQAVIERDGYPHYTDVILTKSGEERTIAWSNTRLQNLQGEAIGTTSIGEDITERRAVEKMKNEFVSIVSHELRTPLTSIRGSLGILATGALDNNPERMRRMIEIAAIDTERLVRLVNDILDLERLESGKITLVQECCDAGALVEQAARGMRSLAEKEKITLLVSPVSTPVWASPDRIIQTLTNLLSNAIKFSSTHSIITMIVEPQGDRVLFQVKDQGRGIPADKLETIFGRFQQVDASDSRSKRGTGLGLAICHSIITQHGGRIWVESVLGEGSTFFFTLPVPPELQEC